MTAYLPSDPPVVLAVAGAILGALVAGLLLARVTSIPTARVASWALLVLGTASVERLSAQEPPGFRMVALITFALVAIKSIVVTEERARGLGRLSIGTWVAFAAAWVGMQPRLFTRPRAAALGGVFRLVVGGAVAVALGAIMIALARAAWVGLHSRLLATVLLLAGLSALVHFGLVERALAARGRPLGGATGRAWTVFWLVLPLPLLFHRPFLAGVAWPLIGMPASD